MNAYSGNLTRSASYNIRLALVLLGLVLGGCKTTNPPAVSEWPASGALVRGMTEAEVYARLGEPSSMEEITEGSVVAHVWRYEDEHFGGSENGAAERVFIEVLFVDGQMVSMKERREVGEMGLSES